MEKFLSIPVFPGIISALLTYLVHPLSGPVFLFR